MKRLIAAILMGLSSLSVFAQTTDTPKIGLVLSGGGAKGLAHIGVLRVLEAEGIPVQVISGTSMGAIVGSLYAMGYSADELANLVTEIDWAPVFTDRILRETLRLEQRTAGNPILFSLPSRDLLPRIPGGIVEGQEAMTLLTRLSWDFHHIEDLTALPIPFVGVATNLQTGQATALTGLPVADVLRASMSLPTVFSPVRSDDEQYIDGGMSRNLPATEALSLGAEILIGVDVGLLPRDRQLQDVSLLDVLQQPWWYQGYSSDAEQRDLIDVLISPDVAALSPLDFSLAGEFIRLGEEAARAAIPSLRALLSGDVNRDVYRATRPNHRLAAKQVGQLEVVGVDGRAEVMVRQRMGLDLPARLGPDDIEPGIARVYGTGLFETVTYQVLPGDSTGDRLVIRVIPMASPDRSGFGLRYDTESGIQVLISMQLRNRLRYDSTTEFHARIGSQGQVGGGYTSRLGPRNRGLFRVRAAFSRAPVTLFLPKPYVQANYGDPGLPEFVLETSVVNGELFVGLAVSDAASLGISAEANLVRVRREAGAMAEAGLSAGEQLIQPDGDHAVATLGAVLEMDSFDRRAFPSSGTRIHSSFRIGVSSAAPLEGGTAEASSPWIRTARVDVEHYLTVSRRISLFGRGQVAIGSGDALPISQFAFLGGEFPNSTLPAAFLSLYGMRDQGRFGRKAWAGSAGVQVEVRTGAFARILANVGDTYDQVFDHQEQVLSPQMFNLLDQPAFVGFALELGVLSPIGPARVIISADAFDLTPSAGLSLGYRL